MSNEEYKELIEKELQDDRITIKDVADVNHHPHPYTIGPAHIKYANDHHSGRIGKETCENVGCAHTGCTTPYDQHTSNKVCFIQFTEDIPAGDFQEEIQRVIDTLPEVFNKNAVEGFAFIEGDGKIIHDESKKG